MRPSAGRQAGNQILFGFCEKRQRLRRGRRWRKLHGVLDGEGAYFNSSRKTRIDSTTAAWRSRLRRTTWSPDWPIALRTLGETISTRASRTPITPVRSASMRPFASASSSHFFARCASMLRTSNRLGVLPGLLSPPRAGTATRVIHDANARCIPSSSFRLNQGQNSSSVFFNSAGVRLCSIRNSNRTMFPEGRSADAGTFFSSRSTYLVGVR